MLRLGLLGLAFAACLLLLVAELTDLYSVHVITVTVKTGSEIGFKLETAGAVLLLFAGVAALVLVRPPDRDRRRPASTAGR